MIEKTYVLRSEADYVVEEGASQAKGTTSAKPKMRVFSVCWEPRLQLKLCESRVWRCTDTDLERYPRHIQEVNKLVVYSMDYVVYIVISVFM